MDWKAIPRTTQKAIIRGLFGVPADRPEKLNILDGVINFKVRQQDGNFVAMEIPDTLSNRQFVQWLQIHD